MQDLEALQKLFPIEEAEPIALRAIKPKGEGGGSAELRLHRYSVSGHRRQVEGILRQSPTSQ
jgi:hypothetical protein